MRPLTVVIGALRYEFLMQVRRPALWIGMALLCPFLFAATNGLFRSKALNTPQPLSAHDAIAWWSLSVSTVLCVGAGLLLADRVPRDRTTHVDEIMQATPGSVTARILGKYCGGTLATFLPISLIYSVQIGLIAARWHEASPVLLAPAAFLAIVVPPVLFVGALSVAGTTLLWTPLYQFLFVGYWMWSNNNPAEALPTLTGTVLNPTGYYAATGLFHIRFPSWGAPPATPPLAAENILILLLAAAGALTVACRGQKWQHRNR